MAEPELTETQRAYLLAFDDFLLAARLEEKVYAREAMRRLAREMLDEAGVERPRREERADRVDELAAAA